MGRLARLFTPGWLPTLPLRLLNIEGFPNPLEG